LDFPIGGKKRETGKAQRKEQKETMHTESVSYPAPIFA
jgi:hypothetical protein